jgi:pilus assembly protein Flp/PilA
MARRSFFAAEDGTTSVEYAVMLALIIVVCIGALQFFGSTAGGSFQSTSTLINSAVGSSS